MLPTKFSYNSNAIQEFVNQHGTDAEKKQVEILISQIKKAFDTIEENRRSRAQGGIVTAFLPIILDGISTTISPWLKTVLLMACCYMPGKFSSKFFPIKLSSFDLCIDRDVSSRPPAEHIRIIIEILKTQHQTVLENEKNSWKSRHAQWTVAGASHFFVNSIAHFSHPLLKYVIPAFASKKVTDYFMKISTENEQEKTPEKITLVQKTKLTKNS